MEDTKIACSLSIPCCNTTIRCSANGFRQPHRWATPKHRTQLYHRDYRQRREYRPTDFTAASLHRLEGHGQDLRIARIEFHLDGGAITIGGKSYDVRDGTGIISQRGTVTLVGTLAGAGGVTLEFAATGYVVSHTITKKLPYLETTMTLHLKLFTATPATISGSAMRR